MVASNWEPGRELAPRVRQAGYLWRPFGKRWFSLVFLKVPAATPLWIPLGPGWRLQNLTVSCKPL